MITKMHPLNQYYSLLVVKEKNKKWLGVVIDMTLAPDLPLPTDIRYHANTEKELLKHFGCSR